MSKKIKFITVLIFTFTFHFSFVFCQFYSEPKIIYTPMRKSETRARSFKINGSRKAFEIRDKKALDISDIYSEKFLEEIESRIKPKSSRAQQWQAAVETGQKSRQEKNVDMLRSEKRNFSEEPTKNQKNSQKETQQLKEEKRRQKQDNKNRKKKEKSLSIEIPKQNKPKELKTEQIRNDEAAVVKKNNLRDGHHNSGLVSRQHDQKPSIFNNHCVKKCYAPKCEVKCSANKCKASTRGPDSAAVCKGEQCQGQCFKAECIAACEGESCSVKCEGKLCHAVAEGHQAESTCEGDYCVAYGKGAETKPRCEGKLCQTWCIGDNCVAKCRGFNCEAMCSGRHCKAQCVGNNCTQFHYTGKPPSPEKPWILDSNAEYYYTTSEEISISDERNYATENDDDDGYYGNKHHVLYTINSKINGADIDNSSNRGNSVNIPLLPVPAVDNKSAGDVTIDYSIAVQLSNRIGEFLKKKIAELQDLSLQRFLPSLI